MTSAVRRLMELVGAKDCFDIEPAELLPVQLEAANERLQSQAESIPLLADRAKSGGVKEIAQPTDLVPLLFAHTTYKTYAEGWLNEGQWDRMGRWLATVSTRGVGDLDTSGVRSLDDWIKQLETVGHRARHRTLGADQHRGAAVGDRSQPGRGPQIPWPGATIRRAA